MKIKILTLLSALGLLLSGCDTHRDLWDVSSDRLLGIEGSWISSLGVHGMTDGTVLLYKDGDLLNKEYLSRPNGVTAHVTSGRYDVVVFNGVMESEDMTNLNHISFRGVDRLETFEARAAEVKPNARLSRAEGEYIASNEMELLTFVHREAVVDEAGADAGYSLIYKDGQRVEDAGDVNYVEQTVEVVPRAVSYYFQVRMTGIVNPRSARSVSGALRGFSGSVFMPREGKKPRAGFPATHHLSFTQLAGSRTRTENGVEKGTLASPEFVTFGPRLPENTGELSRSGEYFFEPNFVLIDGTEYAIEGLSFDVTRHVNEAIATIHAHHSGEGDIEREDNLFIIEIADEIALPEMNPGNGGNNGGGVVDLSPWEDDEEVIVWVGHDDQ